VGLAPLNPPGALVGLAPLDPPYEKPNFERPWLTGMDVGVAAHGAGPPLPGSCWVVDTYIGVSVKGHQRRARGRNANPATVPLILLTVQT
jgi:hypothetical protein